MKNCDYCFKNKYCMLVKTGEQQNCTRKLMNVRGVIKMVTESFYNRTRNEEIADGGYKGQFEDLTHLDY